MHKPRYFLLLAIVVLGLGCYMMVGGTALKPEDWPTYLGVTCLLLALCTAALIEALQAQLKRIEELERRLAERPSSGGPT